MLGSLEFSFLYWIQFLEKERIGLLDLYGLVFSKEFAGQVIVAPSWTSHISTIL